ncbi:MAG: alkaline phosphatase [Elusimicrobiota bacterium]|jgi:alkaline phosphatase|nr:alkaline phosphatase [Elusimicrobiota bacterium]
MVKKFFGIILFSCLFASFAYSQGKKNVILVIADGGGPSIMALLMQYARYAPNSPYKDRLSNIEKIFNEGVLGIVLNDTKNTLVADSAAAATQIASGGRTNPLSIGVDAEGKPLLNLAEQAKKLGKATGVLTDVFVLDATPVVFGAHRANRKDYDNLAKDLLDSKLDVVLGGGLNYFMSKNNLKDPKYENILQKVPYSSTLAPRAKDDEIFKQLLSSGYPLVFHKKNLAKAKGPKLFGLFAGAALPQTIDTNPKSSYPTLREMTQKALEILSKNENGFFLMAEAGMLDWAAHNHDQGAVLQELLELDDLLGYLTDWVQTHPDTLLVLTADHDTSGFAFAYHYATEEESKANQAKEAGGYIFGGEDFVSKANLDIIAKQKRSAYELIKDFNKLDKSKQTPQTMQKLIKDYLAYDLTLQDIEKAGSFNAAIDEVVRRLGIAWASKYHTAAPLFVVFYGAKDGIKGGVMHNTQINEKIMDFLNAK